MPTLPRTWTADDFVTAEFLNTDMYSYVPYNNHFPNGVLFHSMPPMTHGFIAQSGYTVGSSSGGIATQLTDTGVFQRWGNTGNTEVMYVGSNGPFQGFFLPRVTGADTGPTAGGGNYLAYAQPAWNPQTNGNGYAGAYLGAATWFSIGGTSIPSTARAQAPWVLDLEQAKNQAANTIDFYSGALSQDSSGNSFNIVTGTSASGTTSRAGYLWCGAGDLNNPPILASLPVAQTSWTTVSAAALNSGLRNPLAFLNDKPQARVSSNQSGTISGLGSDLALNFSSVDTDRYGGWSNSTHAWTVPMDGVYLCYVMCEFNDGNAGQRRVGFSVNSGAVKVYGPNHSSASGSLFCRPQAIRLLDLKKNDTISAVVTVTGASGTITTAGRMVLVWMGSLASSGTPLTFTPPDVTFRWPAGQPGASLLPVMNQHLGNDLAFLMQRPYLLSYQTSAQSGLAHNVFANIACNNVAGRIHGSFGDNYGGYSSPTYTAPVSGWYLLVGGVFQGFSGTTPYVQSFGWFLTNTANSANPGFQIAHQKSSTATSGNVEGAEGLYFVYLTKGDKITPVYTQYDGSTTFSTTVATAGCESHFGLVWVSE